MTEHPVVFGSATALVGIVSLPSDASAPSDTAILMSNIGMHHRVGPYRMYVQLARRLASLGWPVLRYDQSGMGDSAQRNDAPTPVARAVLDISDAMEYLTASHGISKFILISLCSGVDSAHAVTTRDPRIIGSVFIDGYSYPTRGYYVRRYLLRPLQLKRWVRYFQRHFGGEFQSVPAQEVPAVFTREYPTLEGFQDDVRAMTTRGTRLLFVYSGGAYSRFNSARQLYESLAPGTPTTSLEVEMMYSADHVFASLEQRNQLFQRIIRWLDAFRS